MKSARALKEAADTMCQSPAALQLRYLQVSFADTRKNGRKEIRRNTKFFNLKYFLFSCFFLILDTEQYCRWKEFNNNIPIADRSYKPSSEPYQEMILILPTGTKGVFIEDLQ